MASNLAICDIDPDLINKLSKFRFRKEKNDAAIVMKIDPDKQLVVADEEYNETSVEEVAAELPEHLPRYVAYSYVFKREDGRVAYPLCLIFISPSGVKPELQMMYAGSQNDLVNKGGFSKVFKLRSVEEFTEEWLISELKFFK